MQVLKSTNYLSWVETRAGLVKRAYFSNVFQQFAIFSVAQSKIWQCIQESIRLNEVLTLDRSCVVIYQYQTSQLIGQNCKINAIENSASQFVTVK